MIRAGRLQMLWVNPRPTHNDSFSRFLMFWFWRCLRWWPLS